MKKNILAPLVILGGSLSLLSSCTVNVDDPAMKPADSLETETTTTSGNYNPYTGTTTTTKKTTAY